MQKLSLLFRQSFKLLRNNLNTCILITGLILMANSQLYSQCKQLVWADEFSTNGAPDPTKWGYDIGTGQGGWGNQEQQYYTNRLQNSEVVNGILKIKAIKENFAGSAYTSARLLTKGKFDFTYGRVEARAKFPAGVGTWPAIWMLGSNNSTVQWPACGEIDVAEHRGSELNKIFGTLHYPGRSGGNADGKTIDIANATTAFHIYSMEWSPSSIKIYVDSVLYHTVPNNYSIPFNHNFFLLLNLAMGGSFGGTIDPAFTSATMEVDYIRVYSGSYNYGISGDSKVYNNETNKIYTIDSIPGVSFNWTVPAGAVILSGQGTKTINVNWGSTGGDVSLNTSLSCSGITTINTYKLLVVTEPALPIEKIYEDFQTNRFITYLPNTTGILTQAVANPSATGANTSALAGKYIRNASTLYDVLYVKNITVSNANDFITGKKRLSFDIYSNAPVGSRISMQFENSKTVTATNYPIGRHSIFKAFTTSQNKWETLEFEFESLIDAGTNIFSIDNIVFLFEPNTTSGRTWYFDNIQVRAQPEKPVLSTDILEHYEFTVGKISKGASTGTYTTNFTNPAPNTVNRSAKVAKYVRNAAELYDVLFFSTGTTIPDAGLFKDQTSKMQVDVFSNAPIGTLVTLQLENAALTAGGFPKGTNSKYLAITTKQNEWETLTFFYDSSPDAATSNLLIDRMVFLFNSGVASSNTYYIDNIRIATNKLADSLKAGMMYEDYQTIHAISFNAATGTYTPNTANPSVTGINTSANVGKYIRKNTEAYDNISFVTTIANAGEFITGTKKFAMDIYTSAPIGTVVTWQLESSPSSNPTNYPNGRHSIYQSVVQQTNTWHTLVFSYVSTPDASTTDNSVNRFVLLFNPNSLTGNTYYFDNLRSLTIVPASSGNLPAPWISQEIGHVWGPYGSASYTNNSFTINGSGMDNFFCAGGDQMQFVYQSLSGDGEIIAKVNSLTNPSYARAGVMFKETLAPDSKMAMIDMSPTTALVEAVSRNAAGCATLTAGKYNETIPKWIRLVRMGNIFTSYFSANGTTWTQLTELYGPVTIPMANTVNVGMSVSSGGGSTTAAGVFSNVIVRNIGTAAPAFANIPDENIATPEDETEISMYPNPAGDFLKLKIPGKAERKQIIVNDLSGRVVIQRDLNANTKIQLVDLRNLQSGLYFLTIKTGNQVLVKKFIKL